MRALKILVMVMGVLLILGVSVVIVTIAYRTTHQAAQTPPGTPSALPHAFGNATVGLPPGSKVVEMRGVGTRLALRVELADGRQELLILDADTGALLGAIELRTGD